MGEWAGERVQLRQKRQGTVEMAYRRIGITRRNEDVVDAAGGQATDDLAWMSLVHDRACRDMGARPDTRAGSVAPREDLLRGADDDQLLPFPE